MAKKAKSKQTSKKATGAASRKLSRKPTKAAKRVTKAVKSPKPPASQKTVRVGKQVTVPLHSVAKFVRHLIDEGRLNDFIAAVEMSKAVVKVHPDDLKMAKTFMPAAEAGDLESPAAGSGFNDPCPGGDPFDCNRR